MLRSEAKVMLLARLQPSLVQSLEMSAADVEVGGRLAVLCCLYVSCTVRVRCRCLGFH